MHVKPKKYLGQHFLTSESIAQRIVEALNQKACKKVLEIGAGTGMLTKYLLKKNYTTYVVEIDKDSITYLESTLHLSNRLIRKSFLKMDLQAFAKEQCFAIIGNFPYNISSQIIFKTLEHKQYIPQFVGMFQKEVAQRIAAAHGSKTYGILSVLTQAFYSVEYLFTVPPAVFSPPPKVDSAVIRLTRKKTAPLVDARVLRKIVKTAFGQRRKKMSNSLKSLPVDKEFLKKTIFSKRPEQLSVAEFIELAVSTQKQISHAI